MFIEPRQSARQLNTLSSLNAREGILFIEPRQSARQLNTLSSLNAREGILFIERLRTCQGLISGHTVLMPARAFCLLNGMSR